MKKELKYTIKNGMYSNVLNYSPIGWDDTTITVERSLKTWGITRSYSVSLEFVKDGAEILRDCFYNRLQNEVYLVIEKYNKLTMAYQTIYTGLIDFATYEDTETQVKVDILDTNLTAIIKKYFDYEHQPLHRVSSLERPYRYDTQKVYINSYDCPLEMMKISDLIKVVLSNMKGFSFDTFDVDLSAIEAFESETVYPLITTGKAITGYNTSETGAGEYNYNGQNHKLGVVVISFQRIVDFIFNYWGLSWSVDVIGGIETLRFNTIDDTFPADDNYEVVNIDNFKVSVNNEIVKGEAFVGWDYSPDEPNFTYTIDGLGGTVQYNLKYEMSDSIKYDLNNKTSNNEMLDMRLLWRSDSYFLTYKYFVDYANEGGSDEIYFAYCYYDSGDDKVYLQRDEKTIIEPIQTFTSSRSEQITARHIAERLRKLLKSLSYTSDVMISYKEHYPEDLENFITSGYPDEIDKQEFGNIGVGNNEKYFDPVIFEFEGLIPELTITDLYNPANSLMTFRFKGNEYKGYMIKCDMNVSGKKKTKLTLLSAASNDLTKLIR